MTSAVQKRPITGPEPTAIERWLRELSSNWGGIALIALFWEIAGRLLNQLWLPPFSKVVARLWDLLTDGTLAPHILSSLTVLVTGFAIALVFGLIIGTLMGLSSWVNAALDIYVNSFLFTPGLIFAPILFAIFGLSDATRVSVVVIYAMFIIIINTAAAVRHVDRPLLEMAASYGASRWTALVRIVMPDAFPLIIAGIRMGVGRAVKGMVNGEMFIALIGIGGQAAKFGKQFDFTSVWAISVFIMVIAVIINQSVSRIEQRLTRWVG
ncbi:ABC transporter permease [Celeribacter sp. PS-C1]|uniref:ABC transporter permease n=1 Tax=Celeribacter sp. PS-C1 TaxID=2820813 RepID=UPI001C670981|nr:ABC transporter permease [Celeribacter sp. PS-C1]MBW6416903.1 ABC transporter permease [Celeribacter sp. PS-C1]